MEQTSLWMVERWCFEEKEEIPPYYNVKLCIKESLYTHACSSIL
jgi:hypothetical protein